MTSRSRQPVTTYRLQLRREFTFHDAASIVPYLAELGVSHVYCSPVLQAVPGSAHGYDVVDHSRLSGDLGGAAGWSAMVAACRQHNLGIVIDVVPNHMAMPTPERLNPALWDVLERGPESAFAHWLDVDWSACDGKVLLPVLGKPLDAAVADGEVVVDPHRGVVSYFDHEFPLRAESPKIQDQWYELADWRVANERLNYRRFFDVTTLLGVRVEQPDVFDATHQTLLSLDGPVDGLRIDHPDGLADPRGYLARLTDAAPNTWIVAEKILESGESLPRDWSCAGTTGYDALNAVMRLFVDPASEAAMTELYVELSGMPPEFETVVTASKRQVLADTFGAELARLLRELQRPDLHDALVELMVALDVYRAYDDPESQQRLDHAVVLATQRRPDLAEGISWLREHAGESTRFQQTTGPVMAKGVEDTALYRWHRLVALNEVGGDPSVYGNDVATFHDWCGSIAREWPATMTTLSTHDTKRSADVRARLAVLSELPDEWRAAVTRWRSMAQRHGPPDGNIDYLMWQTLVGTVPISAERLSAYLEKASREAKLQTSWTDPVMQYDEQLQQYVSAVMSDVPLLDDVTAWVDENVAAPGLSNSLGQRLVQLLMPGVPDIYQGDELTDLSLVDPDNRRPVDYELRRQMLRDQADPKLRVTTAAARLRRDRPHLVGASYAPLAVTGPAADHAVGFLRGDDVAVVATRLPVGLARAGGWRDTALDLPGGDWRDAMSDQPVSTTELRTLLADLPVALLVR